MNESITKAAGETTLNPPMHKSFACRPGFGVSLSCFIWQSTALLVCLAGRSFP